MTPQRANVVLMGVVIVLTASLVVTLLEKVTSSGGRDDTTHNARSLVLALLKCADMHHGRLPPAFDSFNDVTYPVSMHVHLLAFLKEDDLYKTFLTQGRGKEDAEVAVFQAPDDLSIRGLDGLQNFGVNLRVFSEKGFMTSFDQDMPPLAAVEPGIPSFPRTFLDGTSNTIALTTKLAECGNGGSRYAADPTSPWAAFIGQNAARSIAAPSDPRATFLLDPNPKECLTTPLMAQSTGPELFLALFDGSVRRISPGISPRTWNLAMQPNDGQPLSGAAGQAEPDD